MYGQPQFLSIPVTSKPNHLIKISEIANILPAASSNVTTRVYTTAASATNCLTITHGADAAMANMTDIQAALTAALDWDVAKKGPKAVYAVTVTAAVSAMAWA